MAEPISTRRLLEHYLNIANDALRTAETRRWRRRAIELLEHFRVGFGLVLYIVDADGTAFDDCYAIYYQDGQFSPIPEDVPKTGAFFAISLPFLEDVWAHADAYRQDPSLLDWNWLIRDSSTLWRPVRDTTP